MKPIISPWLFYLAGTADMLKLILFICGVATCFMAGFFFLLGLDDADYRDEKPGHYFKRVYSKIMLFGAIATLIATFTPSENTCYRMMAASVVTPDNIEAVKDGTEDLIQYIVDTANQITEEKKK